MSQKTQAVANVASNELANQNLELLNKLRDNSGENNAAPSLPLLPLIEVDNRKVEEKVGDRTLDVLCKPQLTVSEKSNEVDENGKTIFKKELFAEKFNAVVLKIRYSVSKKYDPSEPGFWFSPEFDSFSDSLTVLQNKEVLFSGSYQDFKVAFAEKYVLHANLYLYAPEVDAAYKMKVHGASRSVVWDYMKKFVKPDSMTAHLTEFSCEYVKAENPYNQLVLKDMGVTDLMKVLEKQDELKTYLAMFNKESKGNEGVAEVTLPNGKIQKAEVLDDKAVSELFK